MKIFVVYTSFSHLFQLKYKMSKLEFINSPIRNAKLEKDKLEMICSCFVEDFTASQTAKKINISRQTINSYYKILRTYLIDQQKMLDNIFLSTISNKSTLTIKYFIYNSNVIFYVQDNDNTYFLSNENTNKLDIFINSSLKDSLLKHKRANCARVLYNTNTKEYYVSGFLKSSHDVDNFITNRLKKFRGINKENYVVHISESFIRYNNTNSSLKKQLLDFLNIKY
ncbi:hypothetical protein CRV07_06385 [Halarcobacter ebronensis]|uniref:Uncharacterized protein n=2 Tax=Halarcobacter ebronensis TaxID=1462615 RepID=A0A4Q1ALS4_9BACT|nr:hypothetical protein CRV07_06385 [Halarcobacter ebronensis]